MSAPSVHPRDNMLDPINILPELLPPGWKTSMLSLISETSAIDPMEVLLELLPAGKGPLSHIYPLWVKVLIPEKTLTRSCTNLWIYL